MRGRTRGGLRSEPPPASWATHSSSERVFTDKKGRLERWDNRFWPTIGLLSRNTHDPAPRVEARVLRGSLAAGRGGNGRGLPRPRRAARARRRGQGPGLRLAGRPPPAAPFRAGGTG